MAMRPEISVKNLMMQAFLTGWELSDKSISQDEYLQSAIQVINARDGAEPWRKVLKPTLVVRRST